MPGWEKSLNSIIEETTRKETRLYQSECDNLRVTCDELEQKLVALQLQREAELNATVVVIKVAQQKIEALHLQLKYHQKKEQQEQQQNGNSKKKGKKNQNSFNTPQVFYPKPKPVGLILISSHLLLQNMHCMNNNCCTVPFFGVAILCICLHCTALPCRRTP